MMASKSDDGIGGIIGALRDLESDQRVPRNVKSKIASTIKVLEEESELSIKVNKALHELDEISEDTNIQPDTRTQIWHIVAMLERV